MGSIVVLRTKYLPGESKEQAKSLVGGKKADSPRPPTPRQKKREMLK